MHAIEQEQQILSEELKFDKGLILSNEEERVKKIIADSIQSAEGLKEKLSVKEISYTNDYVFASLANRAYEEKKNVDRNVDDLYVI